MSTINKKEARGILAVLVVLFLVYCCSGLLLKGEVISTVLVSLWHVAGIVFPGMALTALLSKKNAKFNIIGWITISFALGYCMNIVSYFIFVPFHMQKMIPCWSITLCVASFFVLMVSEFRFPVCKIDKRDVLGFVFLSLCFVICFLCYSAYHASPISNIDASYETDLMYWIGNTSALTRSFVPIEPRVSLGIPYYYHYFSSIQIAYVSLMSGADVFTLSTTFFAIGKTVLCFGAFYLLFSQYSTRLQTFGLITILFCTGIEAVSIVTYSTHLWINPFGYDIGYAFGTLFLYFFILQNENNFDLKNYMLCVLFFAVCVGSKAPNALVLLVVPGIICLKWLIKKEYIKAFVYGISLIFEFLLIAICCVGLFRLSVGGSSLKIVIPNISKIVRTVVFSNPVIIGLFGLCILLFVLKKEVRNIVGFATMLCGLAGLLLGVIVAQDGHSEMYFTMTAFMPCLLFVLEVISKYEWKYEFLKTGVVILTGVIMCGEIFSMFFMGYVGGIAQYSRKGLKNILSYRVEYSEFDNSAFALDDYNALVWIRNNTPRDSIILSDRSVICKEDGFMYYGVFSERQQYLEGDVYFRDSYTDERNHRKSYIEQLFSNNEEALKNIVREDVDYVVQTKRITPDFEGDSRMLNLIYETATIRVYEVNK